MEALRHIAAAARRRPVNLLYFVVSFGVSFGFIAAVIAIVHASWLRLPSGVADQGYVTALRATAAGMQSMSRRDFEAVAERIPEIRWLYAEPMMGGPVDVSGPSGSADSLRVHLVSGGFFDALGVLPALGSLSAPDHTPGLVLSHASWRRLFGRQDIVGAILHVADGPALPVVGVASPAFAGVLRGEPDAWVMNPPVELSPSEFAAGADAETQREIVRRMANVTVFGTVPDGQDLESTLTDARARLEEYRFDSSLIVADVSTADGSGVTTRQAFAFGIRDTDRVALDPGLETAPAERREVVQKTTWLVGIVAMLLAMALVSVVEFLMAENVSREDEQNVRIAVGATPVDLFRQAIAENVPIAGAMALVAWLTSGYVLTLLIGVEPFSDYLGELSVESRVAGLSAAAVLLLTSLLVCLGYASWFLARSSAALTRSGEWLGRAMRRVLLFVGTASLVVVLSLAERYFGEARQSLGFANADALAVVVESPERRIRSDVAAFVDAVQAVPGVRSAATGYLQPLEPMVMLHSYAREVLDRPDLADTPFFENSVTPAFFETLGVELLAGRLFGPGQGEMVVSRSAAETLGGIEAAVGTPLGLRGQHSGESEATIVGVVDDVPYGGYAATGTPMVYSPIRYLSSRQHWLIDADANFDAVDVLGQSPVFSGWQIDIADTPAETFRKQFLAKRSVEIVLSVAGAFALVLALSGVGNSLARTMAEARTPIGIRFALGASLADLGRAYFGRSLKDLALAGVLVCAGVLVAKTAAPAFAEAVQLWVLLPALAGLVAVCGLMTHALLGRLARRHTVIALVNGTAAPGRPAARGV